MSEAERKDWFLIWFADEQAIIATMWANRQADYEAGYSKANLDKQQAEIDERQQRFGEQLDKFKSMDAAAVDNWCYYELMKRGAIS